jgi:regulation of enolase protein 1 (concanavalin A-like superfamily)
VGTFKAIVIEKAEAGQKIGLADFDESNLMEGDVTVRVEWSTLNYKDGLAITARAPVVRRFPMIPGIDFAGTVETSTHPEWKVGDQVVLNGWGCGETHLGGYAEKARVNGNYSALYDQAGLMVRLDEKHWMKCGSEFVEGKRWASVVFTHDYSDWSTMEDLTQNGPVWWRVVRKKDSIEAQCSKDGASFLTIRQGYFPADVKVLAGVMCAAPEGAGFDAVFDQVTIERT